MLKSYLWKKDANCWHKRETHWTRIYYRLAVYFYEPKPAPKLPGRWRKSVGKVYFTTEIERTGYKHPKWIKYSWLHGWAEREIILAVFLNRSSVRQIAPCAQRRRFVSNCALRCPWSFPCLPNRPSLTGDLCYYNRRLLGTTRSHTQERFNFQSQSGPRYKYISEIT